jgi:hypothetical protein
VWPSDRLARVELGTRARIGCHTFRATGITAYLEAGGTLENTQAMAAHESPRTTKLYDRTGDEITGFESATADPRGEFPLRKPQTCRSSISLMRGVSIYSGASAPVNSRLDNITLI